MSLTPAMPMRRCGKRFETREEAWRSKSGQRPGATVSEEACRCGGFHVAAPRRRAPKTELPKVSGKRRAENRERRALARLLFPEQPPCAVPWCPLMSDDVHETLTRARSGGDITDPDIWVPTCRAHNGELTEEPSWGYALGLLHHSWDDPAEPAPGAMAREAAAHLFARDLWCIHCGSVRSLRPHLRQEHGGHQGCACGWVLLCNRCADTAAADLTGEMEAEGLIIRDRAALPYLIPVAARAEEDRGGLNLWPLCDGTYAYAPPRDERLARAAVSAISGEEAAELVPSLRKVVAS